jgi:hypothetical protein
MARSARAMDRGVALSLAGHEPHRFVRISTGADGSPVSEVETPGSSRTSESNEAPSERATANSNTSPGREPTDTRLTPGRRESARFICATSDTVANPSTSTESVTTPSAKSRSRPAQDGQSLRRRSRSRNDRFAPQCRHTASAIAFPFAAVPPVSPGHRPSSPAASSRRTSGTCPRRGLPGDPRGSPRRRGTGRASSRPRRRHPGPWS